MAKILLAEADTDLREILSKVLKDSGHTVTDVRSGEKALELTGKFDLAVIDLTMGRMNGLETMDGLRKVHPNLKVIISSGYAGEAESAINRGAIAFIAKPFTTREMLNLVSSLLQPPA